MIAGFLIGSGFQKRTDVILFEYSISEDKTTINVGIASSIGYVRGFKDIGANIKSYYLTFYNTFGGINCTFSSKNTFVLELAPNDTEIYFNRQDGRYELVLVKDEETGQWLRP